MAMTVVMQLPPSESSKILVNLEWRWNVRSTLRIRQGADDVSERAQALVYLFTLVQPLTSRARQRYALGAG